MVQITINQHSYSNINAMLNVSAEAERIDTNTISITAEWTIYTAASYDRVSPTRYLVLFIESDDGVKHYSPEPINSATWEQQTTYSGKVVFEGVELHADLTSITIGFGVSANNTSVSEAGTLIWNGDSQVSTDPDIQYGTISGIAKGYTNCIAPTSLSVPEIFESKLVLKWSGAQGGNNNDIEKYAIQCGYRAESAMWSTWIDILESTNLGSLTLSVDNLSAQGVDIARGNYLRFRIQARGSAGEDYYSDWTESGTTKRNSIPYAPATLEIDRHEYSPGDSIVLSWSDATDIDDNISNYIIGCRIGDSVEWTTVAEVDYSVKSYTLEPTQAAYREIIQFAVRAKDSLEVLSEWSDFVTLLRNDDPILYVRSGTEGEYDPESDKYMVVLCEDVTGDEPVIGKYMPYVFNGTTWERLCGEQ